MHDEHSRVWFDEQALRPLCEVNERCIDMLAQMAMRLGAEPPPFALVHQIRDELRRTDAAARRRAAQCPFLLVDLEFRNPEWWRRAQAHPGRSSMTSERRIDLARKLALPMTRATLTLAWHMARSDREATGVSLGLAPSVAQLIATLSLEEIDRLAQRQFHHVRPRWHDRPATWRSLLRSAQTGDDTGIRAFRLHGIQLLGSELIPHCS